MQIIINGETQKIAANTALAELLTQLKLGDGKIAVELNGAIVPRSEFNTQTLAEGDCLEIVQAIGGG